MENPSLPFSEAKDLLKKTFYRRKTLPDFLEAYPIPRSLRGKSLAKGVNIKLLPLIEGDPKSDLVARLIHFSLYGRPSKDDDPLDLFTAFCRKCILGGKGRVPGCKECSATENYAYINYSFAQAWCDKLSQYLKSDPNISRKVGDGAAFSDLDFQNTRSTSSVPYENRDSLLAFFKAVGTPAPDDKEGWRLRKYC
jgi:hypothetical protein